MISRIKAIRAGVLLATFLIAGCAISTRTTSQNGYEQLPWRGRLAVRIESEQPQSFSAGFELNGTQKTGELMLYSPLGSTIAALSWNPTTAIMRAHGETRYFDSLDALIKQAVGTDIPVDALFSWLAGDNVTAAGWSANLSQHAEGKITARRNDPAPQAELRLVLEK